MTSRGLLGRFRGYFSTSMHVEALVKYLTETEHIDENRTGEKACDRRQSISILQMKPFLKNKPGCAKF